MYFSKIKNYIILISKKDKNLSNTYLYTLHLINITKKDKNLSHLFMYSTSHTYKLY